MTHPGAAMKLQMDRIDRQIIAQLGADSSLTSEMLGERVGLSPSAAHRRVKALEEAGIVTGYRARISAEGRGNPSTIFVEISLKDQSLGSMTAFEEAVVRLDYVLEAHLISGSSDYLIKLMIPEDDSYDRVHRNILSKLPAISQIRTHFTIKTVLDQSL
jgi:Lrp/AsnC family leucine-responsive transcriptional regulator